MIKEFKGLKFQLKLRIECKKDEKVLKETNL